LPATSGEIAVNLAPGQDSAGSFMTTIQRLALLYAALFAFVVGIGYVPGLKDGQGYLFGLFSLQWWDDLLHGFSGLWALAAAFISARASRLYFRLFGSVYLFDGVLGLITGQGCLDAGIFLNGPDAIIGISDIDAPARFFANLPHLLIGGFAVWAGFGAPGRQAA
jgi:hypothetical protein